ncbi:hypothetical protein UFOVP325_73 [uncultured Caudovirales phage]|uniref:Uncharacterized protein n=1 Tax=uncultured Caudovirales phage TaxID=2100421 RepID=A0A6J5LX36_9CAUD|nr:hypothetical protein UFOVP325_73 [uncultured Caudovirales phage]CAB4147996.1 hypothetical protein UFOVP430_68 [uncultured Caudovirales phage]
MLVNSNRTGPKDMLSLAMNAQAYRQLRESQEAVKAGNPRAQRSVDNAFEELANNHLHPVTGLVDREALNETLDYFKSHYEKGKSV